MSYDDPDSPDYNDTNVGSGFLESAEERRERKEAERAAKRPTSTETRWPNVRAAVSPRENWLRVKNNNDEIFASLIQRFSEPIHADPAPSLELALDSLEQKLAERKEGK